MSLSNDTLPVAATADTWRYALRGYRRHHRDVLLVLVAQGLATGAALAVPAVIARLVGGLSRGEVPTPQLAATYTAIVAVAALVQGVATFAAQHRAMILSERVLADIREEFMGQVMGLPLAVVERTGTGPIASRSVRDVENLTWAIRFAVPRTGVALITVVVLLIGAVIFGGVAAVALLLGPLVVCGPMRWYLRRARRTYLREGASYDRKNALLTETANSARTVDAMDVGESRRVRDDDALRWIYVSERFSLTLRNRFMPVIEVANLLPLAVLMGCSVVLWSSGVATVEQITAVAFYALALSDPLTTLTSQADEVLIGGTSLSRLLGVADVGSDRRSSSATPTGSDLCVDGVSFEYRPGHPVLHDVSLRIAPGERLAIVGPSGAGKSTLGRLLAGISPPTRGTVTVGGVPVVDLPVAALHAEVALLTQEYHVFVGTIRDNLALALPGVGDAELHRALQAVGADRWVRALPDGLDERVGSGARGLDPAQAQQLALARVVLADPHTIIMDEATSLLDPRAARTMERALGTLLAGRTVISIAHRLHTAHDADRVCVVDAGRITELGSHDELLARGGSYAQLWRTWQADATP